MSVITSNPWSMVLAIFVINVFMLHFNNAYNINVKSYRYMAAAVSFLEVLVYVVGRYGNVWFRPNSKYLCLCVWFSIGILVGMKLKKTRIRLYSRKCNLIRV